jgi:pyruvate formate lyase activating enzyme
MPTPTTALHYMPQQIVNIALHLRDDGLCASFQEPTVLTDWNIPLFKLGRSKGLYSCYVSNGYLTVEAMEKLRDAGMTGLKIDVKGDSETYKEYCGGADVEKVWRNAHRAKKMGFHVEIVNLVVRDVTDSEESLKRIIEKHLKEVGPETPLHFTRYYPAYRFQNPPTKMETLEKAYELARHAGVLYPYLGNVPHHPYENTYCPNCGEILIKRLGHLVIQYKITENKKCPKCGCSIPITGSHIKKKQPVSLV